VQHDIECTSDPTSLERTISTLVDNALVRSIKPARFSLELAWTSSAVRTDGRYGEIRVDD